MKRLHGALIGLMALVLVLPFRQGLSQDNSRYWIKVKAKDKFERSVVADMGLSIEHVAEDYVITYGNREDLNRLEDLGWVESSFILTDQLDFPPEDEAFHNYSELTAVLQKMAADHPGLVNLSSIGKTIEGRDIWALRITKDIEQASSQPAFILMGGHHAREHVSVELPLRFTQWLLDQYQQGNERIVSLVESRDIHVIPAVNPDGLEHDVAGGRYKMWRKNRRVNDNGTYGVDLNRNYGYRWGTGGSSKNPSSDTFMGPTPFSEPETQAIKAYVESHDNISILLSIHTFSKLILYPWGHSYDGISNSQDKAVHEAMAKKMAEWNGYRPQQSSDLYIASGDTTDWSYGEHGIISFTFELDPAQSWGGGGFYPGAGIIPDVVRKNTEPILYLLEHADNPYRSIEVPIKIPL